MDSARVRAVKRWGCSRADGCFPWSRTPVLPLVLPLVLPCYGGLVIGPASTPNRCPWGRSSVGRAPEWHSGGQGFDSPRLHHDFKGLRDSGEKYPEKCPRGVRKIAPGQDRQGTGTATGRTDMDQDCWPPNSTPPAAGGTYAPPIDNGLRHRFVCAWRHHARPVGRVPNLHERRVQPM